MPFGLRVLIDPKSAPIVAGSTLEFSDAMLGGGFKVNNPQAVHECACKQVVRADLVVAAPRTADVPR